MPRALGILDPAGPVARDIDDLWWLLLVLGTAVFVLFAGLLAVGLRRTRDDPAAADGPPGRTAPIRTSPWLVGGGVVLPAVTITVVLAATVLAMRATPSEAPEGAVVVEVIGHQWWWEVRYPDLDVVTANEIHIPAGEPVELHLRSADVVHSFWVPALAGKMDLLPEATNTLVIEADEPGRHPGRCAEFCGLQHARMEVFVVAETPDRFASWVEEQRAPAVPPGGEQAIRGRRVFGDEACARCHTIRGTGADGDRGPDLTHLASRRTIAAGALRLTTEDLTRWIRDPHDVKGGTAMPEVDLADGELDALVRYLEGLR